MTTITKSKTTFKTKDITLMALFAALIAICSWISIPLTIPFTLQTFAVFVTLGVLGGKRGTISVFVYILLGAVGLPVFAGFKGGLGALFGVTGGYIVGFLATTLIYWLLTSLINDKLVTKIVALIWGLIVCYAFGSIWFMIVYANTTGAIGLSAVLGMCVVPYIIPDLIKLALAIFISQGIVKSIDL